MRGRGVQGACQSVLAVVLASLISVVPLLAGAPSAPSAAGQVTALLAGAQRNNRTLKLKDEVDWNDLVRTDRSGRARVSLRDGSILSLGSNSEVKVIAHDPEGQQTLLEVNFGKIRSRVVAISQPGGRFEVRTPLAVVNVLGTDFFTQYDAPSKIFRVICYSGSVKVSGLGKYQGKTETIHAGQMLDVSSTTFGLPQGTLNAIQQDSIAETTTEGVSAAHSDSHLVRNVLIGAAAAAAGVVVGLVATGGASTAATSPSNSGSKKPPQ